jgi:hypothetical protein
MTQSRKVITTDVGTSMSDTQDLESNLAHSAIAPATATGLVLLNWSHSHSRS